MGLLDWVQIFALKILYQRHFERHFLRHVADDYRNACELSPLSGAPAAFPGDQLIAAPIRRTTSGWTMPLRSNRARKLVESLFAEARARLIGAGVNQVDIDLEKTFSWS